jgi:uncharacterized membrane protein YhhN
MLKRIGKSPLPFPAGGAITAWLLEYLRPLMALLVSAFMSSITHDSIWYGITALIGAVLVGCALADALTARIKPRLEAKDQDTE